MARFKLVASDLALFYCINLSYICNNLFKGNNLFKDNIQCTLRIHTELNLINFD